MARVYAGTPATSKSATPTSRAQRMATGRRSPEPPRPAGGGAARGAGGGAAGAGDDDAAGTAALDGGREADGPARKLVEVGDDVEDGGGGGVDLDGGGVGSHAGLDSAGVPSV